MTLAQDLLGISGLPAGFRVEAVVGDTVDFQPEQTFAPATVILSRAPATSTAALVGSALTFDVPGLFSLSIAAGGFSRSLEVIAFPVAVLAQKTGLSAFASTVARIPHLRGLACDPAVTPTTLANSLEADPPTMIGITGTRSGPSWSNYGN
jgi:hypothetical protein